MQYCTGGMCTLPLVAGNFSSPSRFTRMAMLKTAAVGTCWPTEAGGEVQQLSPGTVPDGYPAASPTLLAVMGIIQSVYLPRGKSGCTAGFVGRPSWGVM